MDLSGLYDDLDEFHEQEQQKSKESEALEKKYNEALKTIEAMNLEKKDLRKKIRIMERNLQSLLDTAKAEIQRKDQIIDQMRKEKDDICFRRQQRYHKPNFINKDYTSSRPSSALQLDTFSVESSEDITSVSEAHVNEEPLIKANPFKSDEIYRIPFITGDPHRQPYSSQQDHNSYNKTADHLKSRDRHRDVSRDACKRDANKEYKHSSRERSPVARRRQVEDKRSSEESLTRRRRYIRRSSSARRFSRNDDSSDSEKRKKYKKRVEKSDDRKNDDANDRKRFNDDRTSRKRKDEKRKYERHGNKDKYHSDKGNKKDICGSESRGLQSEDKISDQNGDFREHSHVSRPHNSRDRQRERSAQRKRLHSADNREYDERRKRVKVLGKPVTPTNTERQMEFETISSSEEEKDTVQQTRINESKYLDSEVSNIISQQDIVVLSDEQTDDIDNAKTANIQVANKELHIVGDIRQTVDSDADRDEAFLSSTEPLKHAAESEERDSSSEAIVVMATSKISLEAVAASSTSISHNGKEVEQIEFNTPPVKHRRKNEPKKLDKAIKNKQQTSALNAVTEQTAKLKAEIAEAVIRAKEATDVDKITQILYTPRKTALIDALFGAGHDEPSTASSEALEKVKDILGTESDTTSPSAYTDVSETPTRSSPKHLEHNSYHKDDRFASPLKGPKIGMRVEERIDENFVSIGMQNQIENMTEKAQRLDEVNGKTKDLIKLCHGEESLGKTTEEKPENLEKIEKVEVKAFEIGNTLQAEHTAGLETAAKVEITCNRELEAVECSVVLDTPHKSLVTEDNAENSKSVEDVSIFKIIDATIVAESGAVLMEKGVESKSTSTNAAIEHDNLINENNVEPAMENEVSSLVSSTFEQPKTSTDTENDSLKISDNLEIFNSAKDMTKTASIELATSTTKTEIITNVPVEEISNEDIPQIVLHNSKVKLNKVDETIKINRKDKSVRIIEDIRLPSLFETTAKLKNQPPMAVQAAEVKLEAHTKQTVVEKLPITIQRATKSDGRVTKIRNEEKLKPKLKTNHQLSNDKLRDVLSVNEDNTDNSAPKLLDDTNIVNKADIKVSAPEESTTLTMLKFSALKSAEKAEATPSTKLQSSAAKSPANETSKSNKSKEKVLDNTDLTQKNSETDETEMEMTLKDLRDIVKRKTVAKDADNQRISKTIQQRSPAKKSSPGQKVKSFIKLNIGKGSKNKNHRRLTVYKAKIEAEKTLEKTDNAKETMMPATTKATKKLEKKSPKNSNEDELSNLQTNTTRTDADINKKCLGNPTQQTTASVIFPAVVASASSEVANKTSIENESPPSESLKRKHSPSIINSRADPLDSKQKSQKLNTSAEVKAMLTGSKSPNLFNDALIPVALSPVQHTNLGEIEKHLQEIFQSPAKMDITFSPNQTVEEILNDSQLDSTPKTAAVNRSLNNSLSSSFESKHLSLGKNQYVYEQVSENEVNLFITRRRRKKQPK